MRFLLSNQDASVIRAAMAMFSQSGNKRQKIIKESPKHADITESFAGIGKVEYKGDNASYDDTLCYRYYNAIERIHGKTMEEWIKPAISFTSLKKFGIDSNGKPLFEHNFDGNSIDDYKHFIKSCYEFCHKLGIKRWTCFDRDLMPENENIEEYNNFFNNICEKINELGHKYLLKPLWIAPNFYTNSRYQSTGGICSDANSMIFAGYQTKKCIELSQKIGSESFAMTIIEDGCNSSLFSDLHKEMSYYSRLLKMAADYKDRSGYRGQILLYTVNNMVENDTANANCFFRNNFDRQNCARNKQFFAKNPINSLCFLKNYNLDRFYKLIISPRYYDLCTEYNSVGSLEINQDEIIPIKYSTLLMKNLIDQGGIQCGGINIQPYPLKNISDVKDIFLMYIKQIDSLAKGLKIASKMISDQIFMKSLQQRYATFYNGFGSRLGNGEATLEECEEQIRKHSNHNTDMAVAYRHEHWEVVFKNYLNARGLN